jgi:hypothetical protein
MPVCSLPLSVDIRPQRDIDIRVMKGADAGTLILFLEILRILKDTVTLDDEISLCDPRILRASKNTF